MVNRSLACWAFYRVLREKLEEAELQAGELVAIRRLDDRESAAGHTYRNYSVALDREEAPPVDAEDPFADRPGDWPLAGKGRRP